MELSLVSQKDAHLYKISLKMYLLVPYFQYNLSKNRCNLVSPIGKIHASLGQFGVIRQDLSFCKA